MQQMFAYAGVFTVYNYDHVVFARNMHFFFRALLKKPLPGLYAGIQYQLFVGIRLIQGEKVAVNSF